MVFIQIINSCALHAPLIMLRYFGSSATSKALYFEDFIFLHALLWFSRPILMLIRREIPIIAVPLLVIVSSLVTPLSLGKVRNKLCLPALLLNLNIVLLLIPLLRFCGFIGSWLIWVLPNLLPLIFIVIIKVQFK